MSDSGFLGEGRQIGSYKIKSLISDEGGMGTVFLAIQDQPRRSVALKVMKAGITSQSALRRFEDESQHLARLQHPNIAKVFDADSAIYAGARIPYFAMEYIPNARMLTSYARDKQLTVEQRLELFRPICNAIAHGHLKGIIHRDLKPSNILVDAKGTPKIIDFGLARSTDSDMAVTALQTNVGQLIGTLAYMSPEQTDGDPHGIDTRSDVYALGLVLYELLCEVPPYELPDALPAAIRVIKERDPIRPSTRNRLLRGDLDTILLKAMQKDPSRRYKSADALDADIAAYLENRPILARPPSALYQLGKFIRRNRTLSIASVMIAVVVLAAVVLILRFAGDARAHQIRTAKALVDLESTARATTLTAAQGMLQRGDDDTATTLLDSIREADRGWEWRHLRSANVGEIASYTAPLASVFAERNFEPAARHSWSFAGLSTDLEWGVVLTREGADVYRFELSAASIRSTAEYTLEHQWPPHERVQPAVGPFAGNRFAFDPHGERFLWRTAAGLSVHSITDGSVVAKWPGSYRRAIFGPDGTVTAVAEDGTLSSAGPTTRWELVDLQADPRRLHFAIGLFIDREAERIDVVRMDGSIVSISSDDGSVFDVVRPPFNRFADSVLFSPDGRYALLRHPSTKPVDADGRVSLTNPTAWGRTEPGFTLLDADYGETVFEGQGELAAAAFTSDSRTLALLRSNGTIELRDIDKCGRSATHVSAVNAWQGDSRSRLDREALSVGSGVRFIDGDQRLLLIDPTNLCVVPTWRSHRYVRRPSGALSPGEASVISGSGHDVYASYPFPETLSHTSLDGSCSGFVDAISDARERVNDDVSGKDERTGVTLLPEQHLDIHGELLLVSDFGSLAIRTTAISGNWRPPADPSLHGVARFIPRHDSIVVATADRGLTILDLTTLSPRPKSTATLGRGDEPAALYDLTVSSDGSRIATLCSQGIVEVWDSEALSEVAAFTLDDWNGSEHWGGLVALTHDGETLACHYGTTAYLWNVNTGDFIHALDTTVEQVHMCFHPEEHRLALGADSGEIQIWDTRQGTRLLTLQSALANSLSALSFSDDGLRLVSVGADGTATVWSAFPE